MGLPTLLQEKKYLFLTLELIFEAQTELTINNPYTNWSSGFGFLELQRTSSYQPSRSVMGFSVAPSSTEVFTIQEDISVDIMFLSISDIQGKTYNEFVGGGTSYGMSIVHGMTLYCAWSITAGSNPRPISVTFSKPVTFNIWGYK